MVFGCKSVVFQWKIQFLDRKSAVFVWTIHAFQMENLQFLDGKCTVFRWKICGFQLEYSWKESIWYAIQKWGHMDLKGVNCVHNDKIRSNGLAMSQLDIQWWNWVKWSWKESIVYTIIKLGQRVLKGGNWVHNTISGYIVLKGVNWVHNDKMVLKGVNCVHNDKIRSNGLERSQLGTQYK